METAWVFRCLHTVRIGVDVCTVKITLLTTYVQALDICQRSMIHAVLHLSLGALCPLGPTADTLPSCTGLWSITSCSVTVFHQRFTVVVLYDCCECDCDESLIICLLGMHATTWRGVYIHILCLGDCPPYASYSHCYAGGCSVAAYHAPHCQKCKQCIHLGGWQQERLAARKAK